MFALVQRLRPRCYRLRHVRSLNHPRYCSSSGDTAGEKATAAASAVHKLRLSYDRDQSAGLVVPVYKRALLHGNRTAIKDDTGSEYTYLQLYSAAKKLSFQLSNLCASGSSANVALLTTNTTLHTVAQWACWFSGQTVVPLSPKHPTATLDYYLRDSQSACLISDDQHEAHLQPLAQELGIPLLSIGASLLDSAADAASEIALESGDQLHLEGAQPNAFYSRNRAAMILYTSGSTGPPKGTVITHANLAAQTESLRSAWAVSPSDTLLHVLPLNHVHGCVNALLLPLTVGAKLVAHSRFDAGACWAALLNVNQPRKDRITLLMAVPTIYALLLTEYDKVFAHNARMVEFIRVQCERHIRLMVSGSAPLPASIFQRWSEVTGHRLLERYGMTECGMALSNPLRVDRVRSRQPGRVGVPLPGAEVKLVDAGAQQVLAYARGEAGRGWWCDHELPEYESEQRRLSAAGSDDGDSGGVVGELWVKGPTVFAEYWRRPAETEASFSNGWFRTGDIARLANGTFQILGRSSVDIIKTGGYKVSALEVETRMLDHPGVRDVCVVGVPDVTWGQRVAAVVQAASEPGDTVGAYSAQQQLEKQLEKQLELQEFCRERLASYQVPVEFRWVSKLPRNAMGKVNKTLVLADIFGVKQQKQQLPDAKECVAR